MERRCTFALPDAKKNLTRIRVDTATNGRKAIIIVRSNPQILMDSEKWTIAKMRMQSRMSAIPLGAAAVAVMVIIIAVAISMIPNVSRNNQGSNNNSSSSETFNQQKKTQNIKIANNNTASSSFNSPYVSEYKLSSGTFPNGILVDRNGTVWTVGSQSHSLIAFTPSQEKIKSYQLPKSSSNTPDTLTWTMAESTDDGSILFALLMEQSSRLSICNWW